MFLFSPARWLITNKLFYSFSFHPQTRCLLWIYCVNSSSGANPFIFFFFFFFIGNPETKISRKHIISNTSSNPEPRKESLPMGTAVNESGLLLEVRTRVSLIRERDVDMMVYISWKPEIWHSIYTSLNQVKRSVRSYPFLPPTRHC